MISKTFSKNNVCINRMKRYCLKKLLLLDEKCAFEK